MDDLLLEQSNGFVGGGYDSKNAHMEKTGKNTESAAEMDERTVVTPILFSLDDLMEASNNDNIVEYHVHNLQIYRAPCVQAVAVAAENIRCAKCDLGIGSNDQTFTTDCACVAGRVYHLECIRECSDEARLILGRTDSRFTCAHCLTDVFFDTSFCPSGVRDFTQFVCEESKQFRTIADRYFIGRYKMADDNKKLKEELARKDQELRKYRQEAESAKKELDLIESRLKEAWHCSRNNWVETPAWMKRNGSK